MASPKPVLVAIDLVEDFEPTLREAAAYAPPGAPLLICHVLPDIGDSRAELPLTRVSNAAERVALEKMVEQHIDDVARLAGVKPAAIEIERGVPYVRVVELAKRRKVGLVVAGEPSSPEGWFAGTAERIVRYARCPVLVARGERSGPVVVGTDLSDPSLPAIRAGAELARRSGVGLVVLHVIDAPKVWSTLSAIASSVAATAPVPIDEELLRRAAEDALRSTLASLAKDATPEVAVGRPEQVITRRAAELGAAAIVVGTRGRTGFGRVMIGSVAEAVVRTAPCSVLVVRQRGARRR